MNKVAIEITAKEAKITAEIDGKTFVNTWIKKGRGHYCTKEVGFDTQFEESDLDVVDDLLDALCDIDVTELMNALEIQAE